jgi:hypothetical protein
MQLRSRSAGQLEEAQLSWFVDRPVQCNLNAKNVSVTVYEGAFEAVSSVIVPTGANIQAAIDAHRTSFVFQLSAGIHRGQHFLAKRKDQIIGDPGGGTTLSGAVVLSRRTPSGGLWKASGLPTPLAVHGVAGSNAFGREDLFVGNIACRRVVSISEVTAAKWFFAPNTRSAYISDDQYHDAVEYSVTPNLTFDNGATGVTVSGLTIEQYTTDAQIAPIHGVRGWRVINVASHLNHGAGLNIGAATVVRGGHYVDSGQIGINGWRADGSQALKAEIARNEYAGYDIDWAAGGMKLASSSNVVVSGNNVHNKHGTGLWNDIEDRNFTYSGNTVTENDGNGVMYEISGRNTVISDNAVPCNDGAEIYLQDPCHRAELGMSGSIGISAALLPYVAALAIR